MADGRMLKRAISHSRRLSNLKNDSHRLLYTWLIPFLDVEGRFFAEPSIIKGSVVPRLKKFTEELVKAAIEDMDHNELIYLYNEDGEQYLEFRKFETHQTNLRKDREAPSKIPQRTENNNCQINAGLTPEFIGVREEKRREDKISKEKDGHFFDIFWKVYPKKVNKREAQSRWKNKKLPPIKELLEILEKQKQTEQWKKDGGKFIPHPSTWLNQERWEDEILTQEDMAKNERTEFLRRHGAVE
ncbi:MAG: hypothetical protein ABII74_00690 [Elusimicrobiota bacterium]